MKNTNTVHTALMIIKGLQNDCRCLATLKTGLETKNENEQHGPGDGIAIVDQINLVVHRLLVYIKVEEHKISVESTMM